MKYGQPVSMPSSVSTWLNEQLEARGIDSEVYTRYILSLLHANTLDFLHPEEQEIFLDIKKESKRNAVSQKRFRSQPGSALFWWRYARLDADKIKRSAAVKCLKSAADQNCEIESLVNELCEKLKEADSPSTNDNLEEPEKSKNTSRKELAEKYYAAFPPLCPDSPDPIEIAPLGQLSKFEKSVWLTPQKHTKVLTSPQKKLGSPKKSNNCRKKHAKNRPRMESFRVNNNNRYNTYKGQYQKYTKEEREQLKKLEKEMMENFNTWQFLNNFSLEERDQCLEPTNTTLPDEQDDIDMYDSLPVNLENLLDDPVDSRVDIMNSTKRPSAKQHNFIPFSTNMVSSIWSNEDSSGVKSDVELALDYEFGAISIDGNQKDSWPNFTKQNETNHYLEQNSANTSVFAGFRSLPPTEGATESEFSSTLAENNECLFDMLTISLMKINHSKETSNFVAVVPRTQPFSKPFNPFGNYTNPAVHLKNAMQVNDKEDLLTSEISHFKPIKEAEKPKEYPDGASFVINGNLEKVEYKRSNSSSMYLEQEFGQVKKYREYRCTNEPELGTVEPNTTVTGLGAATFVPKFCVDQNDVGCQTESQLSKTSKCDDLSNLTDCEIEDDVEKTNCSCDTECTCEINDDNGLKKDRRLGERRNSITEEVSWPYEVKSCDKCNNNNDATWNTDSTWNMDWINGTTTQLWQNTENEKNIWSGGEVCQACLRLNGARTPQTDFYSKLKKDVKDDGEKLLTHISNIQQSYNELSMPIEFVALEPLSDTRKRRHSYIDNATEDIWDFSSRFSDDFRFKMWTLPTLRSVTL